MNICVDSEATSRLAKFFKNDAEERWICLPSLNLSTLPLPNNEDSSDTEEMPFTIGDGEMRILTDITKNTNWELLQKLVSTKNVEIRHCKYIDMTLFILPEMRYTMTLVKKYNDLRSHAYINDESVIYDTAYSEDEIVLFESDIFDYKRHYRLFSMFKDLWDDSEIITAQKLEMYMNLAKKAPCSLQPKDGIPVGTCLLHSCQKDDECTSGVFCSRIKSNYCFLPEDEPVTLSYIMGLDIPKETKYIIYCKLNNESKEIDIYWIYAVDALSPLDFDDFLWNDVKGKKEEFVIIEPNYIDKNIEWFPTHEFHFDLPSPEMAARKMFMLSEVDCDRCTITKLEKKLNKKMKTEEEFKESVLHKSFVKVK